MRPIALVSTVAAGALAAGALLIAAPAAGAQVVDTVDPVDLDVDAGCVIVQIFTGKSSCATLEPADLLEAAGSLGYGSFGTGSLMDLLTGAINTGSVLLSVDLPNSTGSYAPGSFGSYGPEAIIGQLSTTLTGSLGLGS